SGPQAPNPRRLGLPIRPSPLRCLSSAVRKSAARPIEPLERLLGRRLSRSLLAVAAPDAEPLVIDEHLDGELAPVLGASDFDGAVARRDVALGLDSHLQRALV